MIRNLNDNARVRLAQSRQRQGDRRQGMLQRSMSEVVDTQRLDSSDA